jgi:hypothetical protein
MERKYVYLYTHLPVNVFETSEFTCIQVETAMIGNLRSVMASSVAAYATTPRIQWVLQWPGQAVLAVTGIYWTKSVADALASGIPGSLQAVADQNSKDLADIVTLVRGKLQRLQRATLSALVVMDVHARDAATELASQVLPPSSAYPTVSSALPIAYANRASDQAKLTLLFCDVLYANSL